MNLNQVTLPVKNMAIACDFYRRMGILQIVDTEHYARFQCPVGQSSFSLALNDNDFNNGTVIYFEHDQLDSWVNELIDQGFSFIQLPTDQSYLWREAIIEDPSGNKIKLYSAGENRLNPPWRVELS